MLGTQGLRKTPLRPPTAIPPVAPRRGLGTGARGATLCDDPPRLCAIMRSGSAVIGDDNKMEKVFIYLTLGAVLAAAGCSGPQEKSEDDTSALDRLPFVYKMTVQQGNIITEEMVDRLELGMSKGQVRFLLGTPMLTDMFHADRWDYTYTIRRGHQDMESKRLTLFFEQDALAKVVGDMHPDPQRAAAREPGEMIVSVPDWEDKRGFFARVFGRIGGE